MATGGLLKSCRPRNCECYLAGHFGECCEEFETFAHLMAIDRRPRNPFVVCDDPANLMGFTIGPKQSADLPDVIAFAAMGAAVYLTPAVQRKRNHIVDGCRHFTTKLINVHASICDKTLIVLEKSASSRQF